MSQARKPRFHRSRSVRLHASGKWICTIGRVWSVRKAKLLDKDWYFEGSEGDAVEKANAKARQGAHLPQLDRLERPALEILGEPLPHEPRWPSGAKTPQSRLTTEQLVEARRVGVDWQELAEAFAECTFTELITKYGADRRKDVNEEQVELSTLAKEMSQMRQVAKFLPAEVMAIQLRAEHFRTAKTKMLAKYERRTVRNYLSAGAQLLRWLYGRYGGDETRNASG
jgi:hypothetical protein